jgi:hypothetical protein
MYSSKAISLYYSSYISIKTSKAIKRYYTCAKGGYACVKLYVLLFSFFLRFFANILFSYPKLKEVSIAFLKAVYAAS